MAGMTIERYAQDAGLLAAAHRPGLLLQPRPGGELLLAHEGEGGYEGRRGELRWIEVNWGELRWRGMKASTNSANLNRSDIWSTDAKKEEKNGKIKDGNLQLVWIVVGC